MHVFRGLHTIPPSFNGCVATIGNFDGVHLGHQVILNDLKAKSVQYQLPSLVITFEPLPKEFFAPQEAPPRLTTLREKLKLFSQQGVDYILCLPFNQSLRSMTGDDFIREIIHQSLSVKHLIVGDDFRFGCDRRGDFDALVKGGTQYGYQVQDTSTYELDGERVSSTRIRSELAANNLPRVQKMLAQPYAISGRVAYGRQLGRTLNTPTANILVKRHKLALSGVFCVLVFHEETGEEYIGVANVGVKPTISGENLPSVEVHLFGFSGNLYGHHLQVEFLHKIREEKKFASIAELQQAIEHDKKAAKQYLAARPNSLRF